MALESKANITKNYTISLLRFIAMTFIITCHFFQYYNSELARWFNVGVQIFFCISGFLYGNKNIKSSVEFFCKNSKKILIPYFCFLIPAIGLYVIFHRDFITKAAVFKAVLTSGTIKGIGHLWFIGYILFCYLITPYLQDIREKMKNLKWQAFIGVFAMLAILGLALTYAFDSFFVFSRVLCYLFGYFGAVFYQNYKKSIFKILVCLLSVLTIVMNIARIYFKYINPRTFTLLKPFVEYSHAFLGISITFIFIVFIKNIKRCAFLDLTDKYSFYIYIVHQIFIIKPFSLLALTPYTALNWFIVIVGILVSGVVLKIVADFVERIFTRVVEYIKVKISTT